MKESILTYNNYDKEDDNHDITFDELLEAFPLTEINTSGKIFSVDNSSMADVITPAKALNTEVTQQVVKIAKVAYRALNLCGLATFDFIVKVSKCNVSNKFVYTFPG